MKRILFLRATVFILLFFLVLTISCKTPYNHLGDGIYAEMNTQKGKIVSQLYYENVPLTVANFMTLAEGKNPKVSKNLKGKPYYNGLVFHRVIENFVIQTGCPLGTGKGNPGYQFRNEVPRDKNGNLKYKHGRGVLAMANAGPDTNGSQFYITRSNTPHLDGGYTVFGKVLQGMDVVDSIRQGNVLQSVKIYKVGRVARKFKEVKVFKREISR